ncbi:hypothetical protein ACFC09_15515 [Streptomyces sp. NPDC056161]|uniref:hypothetical protein n=1 Tax=Streptomyces sp. NPDC056161 TaxID=3345732 RepID=UPI0035D72179
MAWAYAELSKEAAKRGGPVGLRCFYTGQGVIIGVTIGSASVAGTLLYEKWRARRAAAVELAHEDTTGTPVPGSARTSGRGPGWQGDGGQ